MVKKVSKRRIYSKKRNNEIKICSKKRIPVKKTSSRTSYKVNNNNIQTEVFISSNGKVKIKTTNLSTGKTVYSNKPGAKRKKRKPSTEGPGPSFHPKRR